jgi:hypothetical protein
MTFDDDDLMAYADGRAEPALAGAIEAAMETRAETRQKVLAMVGSTHRLRTAYHSIADEPVPGALVATVRAAAQTRNATRSAPSSAPRWQTWRIAAGFLVAAVLGGVGGGWATMSFGGGDDVADIDSLSGVYQAAVDRALEEFPNGKGLSIMFANGADAALKPVSTFINDAGEFCREFETSFGQSKGIRVAVSVACRRDAGGWRIDGAFLGAVPAQEVLRIGYVPK